MPFSRDESSRNNNKNRYEMIRCCCDFQSTIPALNVRSWQKQIAEENR